MFAGANSGLGVCWKAQSFSMTTNGFQYRSVLSGKVGHESGQEHRCREGKKKETTYHSFHSKSPRRNWLILPRLAGVRYTSEVQSLLKRGTDKWVAPKHFSGKATKQEFTPMVCEKKRQFSDFGGTICSFKGA